MSFSGFGPSTSTDWSSSTLNCVPFVEVMFVDDNTVHPAVSFSRHLVSQDSCALSNSGMGASIFFCPSAIDSFNCFCRVDCSGEGSLINGSGLGLLPSMTASLMLLKKEYIP